MWVHATSAGACEPQKPYCGYQGTDAWPRCPCPLPSRMSRHHGAKAELLGRTSIDTLASESAATNPGPRNTPTIARTAPRRTPMYSSGNLVLLCSRGTLTCRNCLDNVSAQPSVDPLSTTRAS